MGPTRVPVFGPRRPALERRRRARPVAPFGRLQQYADVVDHRRHGLGLVDDDLEPATAPVVQRGLRLENPRRVAVDNRRGVQHLVAKDSVEVIEIIALLLEVFRLEGRPFGGQGARSTARPSMQPTTSNPVPAPSATAHRAHAQIRAHEPVGMTTMSGTLTLRNTARPPRNHHAIRGYRAGESKGWRWSQRPAYAIPREGNRRYDPDQKPTLSSCGRDERYSEHDFGE